MQKMRRGLRSILILVPAAGFIALLALGFLKAAPSQHDAGSVAPEFSLPLLDGTGSLSSDMLRGRPLVINVWASWCQPCRQEAPLLEKAWRRYKAEGVVFLGVNVHDAKSDARRFVQEFNVTYPVVRDTGNQLSDDLGVTGIPETFFVDQNWRLVESTTGTTRGEERGTVVLGAIPEEQLVSNVEALIRRAGSKEDGTR